MEAPIKELLHQGKTREALTIMAQRNDKATILLNRFTSAHTQYQLSLIDYDEFSRIQAQIVHAALQLRVLEEKDIRDESQPSPETSTSKTAANPSGDYENDPSKLFDSVVVILNSRDRDMHMRLEAVVKNVISATGALSWVPFYADREDGQKEWERHQNAEAIVLIVSMRLLNAIRDHNPWLTQTINDFETRKRVVSIFSDKIDWTLWPVQRDRHLPSGSLPVKAFADLDGVLAKVAKSLVSRLEEVKSLN